MDNIAGHTRFLWIITRECFGVMKMVGFESVKVGGTCVAGRTYVATFVKIVATRIDIVVSSRR